MYSFHYLLNRRNPSCTSRLSSYHCYTSKDIHCRCLIFFNILSCTQSLYVFRCHPHVDILFFELILCEYVCKLFTNWISHRPLTMYFYFHEDRSMYSSMLCTDNNLVIGHISHLRIKGTP